MRTHNEWLRHQNKLLRQDRDQLKAQLEEAQKTIRGLKDSIHEHIDADRIRAREIQQLRAQLEDERKHADALAELIKDTPLGPCYCVGADPCEHCNALLERRHALCKHATRRKGEREKV